MPAPIKSTGKYDPCPCTSGKVYHKCCQPFHDGTAAPTALALMRSRYCAYALGLAQYIIDTTCGDSPHYLNDKNVWLAQNLEFSNQVQFTGLTILESDDSGNPVTVTFKAHLQSNNQDVSFIEKSDFYKHGDRWYYHSGAQPD